MLVGLIGNQNSGKTTLFNALTGSNQKIGNWPGVTIERKEGFLKGSKDVTVVDTPGVYSLSPYTDEEKTTRSFCLDHDPDLIINIIDATAIERSLYLTTQLLELNTDVIVACNMADILESRGLTLDIDEISKRLGTTVIRISAKTGEGLQDLINTVVNKSYLKNPHKTIFSPSVQKEIDHLESDLVNELEEVKNPRFSAVKLFENDPYFTALTNKSTKDEIQEIEKELGMDAEQIIADQRYKFVTSIVDAALTKKNVGESWTDKLDKIFLNRFLAIPLFIIIMGLVYFLSVGVIGTLTVDFIDALFNGAETITIFENDIDFNIKGLGPLLGDAILNAGGSDWAADLVQNGIVGGVGAVCNFIPQLIILFTLLALLETSGYMSRISFLLDRLFKKLGLSGKSLIPFIVGSGCSVPGIATTKTIEDQNERKLTILLTPFIPCSAKLPIISLLSEVVFVGTFAWFGSLCCYLIAIVVIILSALVLRKFFKSSSSTFISELPAYKVPSAKYVGRDVFDKTIAFIKRAGTVILLCSVLIWTLSRFTWNWTYVIDIENASLVDSELEAWQMGQSMLASIGKVIAFVFIPTLAGNYSWGAAISAVQGLIAKEQVVSSMQVVCGSEGIFDSAMFAFFQTTPIAAFAYMMFVLFSAPCIGAISATYREYGKMSLTLKAVAYQIGFALLLSSLIGCIGWAANGWSVIGL